MREKLDPSVTNYRRWRRNTKLRVGDKVICIDVPTKDCSCGGKWYDLKEGVTYTIKHMKGLNERRPTCIEGLIFEEKSSQYGNTMAPYWSVIPA